MKIKSGFNLRKVCGENIILAEGQENIDFSMIIHMNESAAFLWKAVGDMEFTINDLATILKAEYDIDETTAMNDANDIAQQWLQAEIIEA